MNYISLFGFMDDNRVVRRNKILLKVWCLTQNKSSINVGTVIIVDNNQTTKSSFPREQFNQIKEKIPYINVRV